MTSGFDGRRREIESALLDYHRAPGKYPLVRRQPALLFSSIREILQLASGRALPSGDAVGPSPAARQAACFFIRSALLYPGADHYALLGLERAVDGAAVKERYRLMMRLMHPDFSSSRSTANWPADAASRLNQAYEVLSSPVQRRRYDEQLNPASRAPPPPDLRAHNARIAAAKPPAADPRRRLRQLAAMFGIGGAIALAASLYVGSVDNEILVQRKPQPDTVGVDSIPASPQPAVIAALSIVEAPKSAVDPQPARSDIKYVPDARPQANWETEPIRIAMVQAQPRASVPAPVAQPIPLPAPTFTPFIPSVSQAVAASVQAPSSRPATQATPPAPSATPAKAPVRSGFTIDDVHPLLAKLLQQMESGWGDRLLTQLDRDTRAGAPAQAFLSHYNALVDGMRPVRLSNVHFESEPRDGRLLVTGHISMHVRDAAPSAAPKELALVAEFAMRDGAVVMTRLERGRD